MKTYEEFINESVKDLLRPKSEDEIKNIISGLNVGDKIRMINMHKLDNEYYPTDEEIHDYLDTLDTLSKIEFISDYKLDKKFLPPDDDIDDYIDTLDTLSKIEFISDYKLDKKFLPPDDDIKNYLSTLDIMVWVRTIKKYGLDDKFLPSTRKIKKEVFDKENMKNFQKSFYHKSSIIPSITDKDIVMLKSYNTIVAEYNFKTKKLQINGWYSVTTQRHINAFIEYLGGVKRISKREATEKSKIKL